MTTTGDMAELETAYLTLKQIQEKYGEVEVRNKGSEPFVSSPEGHPMGVVLTKKETGEIICLICGDTSDWMVAHLHHAHQMSPTEYKEQFGLNKKAALVSSAVSWKMSQSAKGRTPPPRATRITSETSVEMNEKRREKGAYGLSIERRNKKNSCPAQYLFRYVEICREEGRLLTQREVDAKDPGILIAIKRHTVKFDWEYLQEHARKNLGKKFLELANPSKDAGA